MCACAWVRLRARSSSAPAALGGAIPADDTRKPTTHTRVQSKIHSLANLAAARATCQPAAAARRSQARRGGAFSADHRDDAAADEMHGTSLQSE